MRAYSKLEVLHMIEAAALDIKAFYKQGFINYRGVTADTKEPYTEVICNYLLDHRELFDIIPVVTRESSYKQGHTGTTTRETSNRVEERMAMRMFNQGKIPGLGRILDYQIPLKNKRSDTGLGKIDLLILKGEELLLLELKIPDSKETMLRCVLEGATYQRIIDEEKMKRDFDLSASISLRSCPLVRYQGAQHRELQEQRPNLLRLMEFLDSRPLYYLEEDGEYHIIDYDNP